MTTYAPNRLEELEAREREAWSAYQESLRNLAGRAYDDAEAACWEELQHVLAEVEAGRAKIAATDQ
jgi:hypothetical protein